MISFNLQQSYWQKFINRKNRMNGLELLNLMPQDSVRIAFFDPQYRGVLDKLAYGNEGKKRGKERAALPQMSSKTIAAFIAAIRQKLLQNGYLFLWVDKFHLVEGISPWLSDLQDIFVVDMIAWDKQRIGMGYRSRRRCEYLVVLQKSPKIAKNSWKIHNIPDIWQEKIINKQHTHAKPVELQKSLILATTNEGDIVLDPAAGGYSVFDACREVNRNFIGCDLVYGDEI